MILEVTRVRYGQKDTPEDRREYQSVFSSAVGNRVDWLEVALTNGYEAVHFYDNKGSIEAVMKVQK
jgi:hypothetical protein